MSLRPNESTKGISSSCNNRKSALHFSAVNEVGSPVLRDDHDEMMWERPAVPVQPFEFNNVAGRLRSRRNSMKMLRSTSYSGQTYGTSGDFDDNDANKDITFDGDYHSVYISPAPKGWRGILVLMENAIILRVTMFHQELAGLGFIAFLLFSLVVGGMGTVLVHFVCPQAAGSGLPQMKVALSGVDMREFLSPTCLLVKMAGLVSAYAAGLSIGKEGPFIMMSCCFADILMQMGYFRRIYEDSSKRLEMLSCACAAGVAATFGTPFGGVLFSVEVTASFYMVRNLPRSFFAALAGAVTIAFLVTNGQYGLFDRSAGLGLTETNFTKVFTYIDGGIFVFIGVVSGVLGAVFIWIISVLVRVRDTWFLSLSGPPLLYKRIIVVLVVTVIANISYFYGDPAWFLHHGSPQKIIDTLFTQSPTREDGAMLARSLLTFLPLKYFMTIVCVVVPLPAGIFTPTFVIGGIFGRLVGEAIVVTQVVPTKFEPYEFAIIGAAAFSSGVTRAISTAVIIMEISHNGYLTIPVSIAILSAYFTGGRFIENVYDVLITTSRLPRLKKLPKAAYDIPTWEVMKTVDRIDYLSADITYRQAHDMLTASHEPVFPIVDNIESMQLVGAVTRSRLQEAVDYCKGKAEEVFHDGKQTSQKSLLDWRVQFAYRRGGHVLSLDDNTGCSRTKLTVLMNPSPFQVVEMTPMQRVDAVFRMLKLNNAYVTQTGKLVGVISRARLMRFLGTATKYRIPGVLRHLSHIFCNIYPDEKHDDRELKDEPNADDYVPIP
ncbi:hypothetical protein, variant 1 [Aphanomyces invadans]|uniref:Chloride channel protein n=1 Tax=Aphanomyces invadans TaxID=157072 RepID=A0A024USA7_9STRA|nr:hypothetical protein, variant 1 [Aphanomyces invadans]ETW09376.1 hypothetical protein, variant 1 [Aphanomyces invadans]|eukprot:XP_008863181.1 hypothetical protein, variant 1 [Aphanomyces invadans]